MSLIVTGSIGIDCVQTPSGHANNVLGGSAVYFAAAASILTPVRLVAAAGEDFPAKSVQLLKKFDIDLGGLELRPGSKTFRWSGKYHQNMNIRDTLSVQLNVLAEKLPPVPQPFQQTEYVFLANTHPGGQLELLQQFPKRKLAVADTMDLWINNERPLLMKLLKKIDGLVLNDSEALLLTGADDLLTAAEKVLKMGPKFVVIKKGEHGCMLMHQQGVVVLPAYPTASVVDPTGAGDSFAGGMMGCLAAGKKKATLEDLRTALAHGTILASFNIEAFSLNRLLKINKKDVTKRLEQYKKMLRIK